MNRKNVRTILLVCAILFGIYYLLNTRTPTVQSTLPSSKPLKDKDAVSKTLDTAGDQKLTDQEKITHIAKIIRDPNRDAFPEFTTWANLYLNASSDEKPALLEEGERLSIQRREGLSKLIEDDPRVALAQAVTYKVRKKLPERVTKHFEQRESFKGDLQVQIETPADPNEKPIYKRTITVHEPLQERFLAGFVYGSKLVHRRIVNQPFHGISIDKKMAVDETAIRQLEAGEPVPSNITVSTVCPVSSMEVPEETVDETESEERKVVDIGGEFTRICRPSHIGVLEQQYQNRALSNDIGITANTWNIGAKKVLVMLGAYAGGPGAVSASAITANFNQLNPFYSTMSYGQTSFVPTITAPLTIQSTAAYAALGYFDYYQMLDAKAAATAAGYNLAEYDRYMLVLPSTSLNGSIAGIGDLQGRNTWIYSLQFFVTAHELGHNAGLEHASTWITSDESISGDLGTKTEYGNIYDVMGRGFSALEHFNANYKNLAGWLPNQNIPDALRSGLYRIYPYESSLSLAGLGSSIYALQLRGVERSFCLETRKNQAALIDQVLVHMCASYTQYAYLNSYTLWRTHSNNLLLDTTTETSGVLSDVGLFPGRTFDDLVSGYHVTNISRNAGSSLDWTDVVVNRGYFPDNTPPTVSLTSSATSISSGASVTLTATATDPEGDALAYDWDFGDGQRGQNSAVVTKSWSINGRFSVRCTVSDMKGGKTTKHIVITVGSPSSYLIQGRVIDSNGIGVSNVRVHNGLTGAALRSTYTDINGYYTLGYALNGSYSLQGVKYSHTITSNFTNPVSISGGDVANLNFNATEKPKVSLTTDNIIALENGSLAGRFTISRTGSTAQPLTVQLRFYGAAYNPKALFSIFSGETDFNLSSNVTLPTFQSFPTMVPSSVVIPAGQASVQVTVNALADASPNEVPESLRAAIVDSPSYVAIGAPAAMMIVDSGGVKPTVSISTLTGTAVEPTSSTPNSQGVVAFNLTRTGSITDVLVIPYNVSGSATNGVDYFQLPLTATFEAGQSSTVIEVWPKSDGITEGSESVIVTLPGNSSYAVGSGTVQGSITEGVDTVPPAPPSNFRILSAP